MENSAMTSWISCFMQLLPTKDKNTFENHSFYAHSALIKWTDQLTDWLHKYTCYEPSIQVLSGCFILV